MKSHGGVGKTTPLQLLHEGKVWLGMWENALPEGTSLLPATYCLFTALELYMKAYLVFKNSSYTDIYKLKNKCGHKFQVIHSKIATAAPGDLADEIGVQIKKYELEDIALDKLKYPESGRVWLLNHGLEKKNHTLGEVFKRIDAEISTNHDQWLIDTYPKKIELGAMIQEGYVGKIEDIDLEKLSNVCSECLPNNVIISEYYAYPWHHERIPFRECILCKKTFNPGGMRPSITELAKFNS